MKNILSDLSEKKIKRALLACGREKPSGWERSFWLLLPFKYTYSQSSVGICFVGNEWWAHMGDIYSAGCGKAGHSWAALL